MNSNQIIKLFGRYLRWDVVLNQRNGFSRSGHRGAACYGTASSRRSDLFTGEKKAQKEAIGRIEKIEVTLSAKSRNATLVMNKDISTPFDCARHLSDFLAKNSVLALVDERHAWDMHKPLPESCNVRLLSMIEKNPWICNNAFWRSCSLMLGAVVSNAFRDDVPVVLHSFPPPNVTSGSFVLDAFVGLENWKPSPEELRALSGEMLKLAEQNLPFERLVIGKELAEEMFADNPYKLEHIANIFSTHNDIIVYRVGDHVDISRGPMINHTGLIGRCTIASVHKMEDVYRFQGVALPKGISLNHFAYGILEDRAKLINTHVLPPSMQSDFTPEPDFPTEVREVTS